MILITKIHNPPSLLFWLRRAFSLRDIHQEKNEMQKQNGRGEIIEEQGEENLPLVCSFQQNTLHTLVTNCHSTRKHFGNIFRWTAASLLTNLLQMPWVLQDSHGQRAAVSLGIPSLSLHGVFSIHLHLSSKLMAKFSSKDGNEPTQLSNFDVIFSSGKWMAVDGSSVSAGVFGQRLGNYICGNNNKRSCKSGRFYKQFTDFVHNCPTQTFFSLLSLSNCFTSVPQSCTK